MSFCFFSGKAFSKICRLRRWGSWTDLSWGGPTDARRPGCQEGHAAIGLLFAAAIRQNISWRRSGSGTGFAAPKYPEQTPAWDNFLSPGPSMSWRTRSKTTLNCSIKLSRNPPLAKKALNVLRTSAKRSHPGPMALFNALREAIPPKRPERAASRREEAAPKAARKPKQIVLCQYLAPVQEN